MKRSSAPDFTLNGITWQCWVVGSGDYEWRSTCGRYATVQEGLQWRIRRGDRVGQIVYRSLKQAMLAALLDQRRAA